jgi:hypothetical protein
LIRLVTLTLGGESYLNFMGNEFGRLFSKEACMMISLLHCFHPVLYAAIPYSFCRSGHPEWIDFPRVDR